MPRLLIHAAAVLLVAGAGIAGAQTPAGTLAGVVRDSSGTAVAGAQVVITNVRTGIVRTLVTSDGGQYAAPLLPPGTYTAKAQQRPLRSTSMSALVQAGMSTTIDLVLSLEVTTEAVMVSAAGRLRDDHHQITGWIDRGQIDQQPLNGRNVLELAKLEPGVTNPARVSGGRVFVAPLGAGLNPIPRVGFTRVTVDGMNIETPGTVGSLLQISPDVVDQMQLSSANFDMSTGLATSGAVDIVTRSGGNRFAGSAFSLYRDRRWSEYPESLNGSVAGPSFRRYQAGATAGGPIRENKVFFFAGYERHDQHDVVTVAPADPDLRPLGGTFVSPYSGSLVNARIDMHLASSHAFFRHSRDSNDTYAPTEGVLVLPSGWSRRPVRANQSLASVTSILNPTLVNDLRVSYYATDTAIAEARSGMCPPPCIGRGAPRIAISDGSPGGLTLGSPFASSGAGNRFQISETLVRQMNSHLLRAGFEWELTRHSISTSDSDPVLMTLWMPTAVRQRAPGIALPSAFASIDDLMRLPLRSFTTSVGPWDVLQRGFQPSRRFDSVRAYVSDRWNAGSRISINAGAAWSFEPGVLNDDLAKPDWLEPIAGNDGLRPPGSHANLSGTVGAVWRVSSDGRTIVRAGVGRYVESLARTVSLNLANERVLLSPLGTSRLVVSGSNIVWNGVRLNFPQPTTFTAADLMAILPSLRAQLAESLNPQNRDFSIVNLDKTKEGRNIYDASYSTPHSLHATVGAEREIGGNLIVSADFVWKRFSDTFINGIDYNRFFSAQGPVIPACTAAQRTDVLVTCTNGSVFFDTTSGHARYAGLLVRAEKRFSGPARFLVSYAYGSFVGTNGTGTGTTETSDGRVFGFNNDDWSENYGPLPTDIRHVVNASGLVTAGWGVNLSFNLSAYSAAPFSAYVGGMDFNGDGTSNDLLPGTTINQFNRGLDGQDLIQLVAAYNATYAGHRTAGGQTAPPITLPADFRFNDSFVTLDLRIARAFQVAKAVRLSVFADIFNVMNTVNQIGFSGNLASTDSFGQPGSRVGQAFGSGGPRAAQLGVRIEF